MPISNPTPLRTQGTNFVTVRNPQAPNPRLQALRCIRYDAAALSSTFISTLAQHQNEAEASYETKMTNLQASAKTFWESTESIKSLEALQVLIPNIDKISIWLRLHEKELTTTTLLADLVPLCPLGENLSLTETGIKISIWNTLVALNTLGLHVPVKDYLNVALRMFHFVPRLTAEMPDMEAKLLVSATILLPKSVFPLPKMPQVITAPPTIETPPNLDPHKEQREKYESTLAEIRKLYSRRLAMNRGIKQTTSEENPPENTWEQLLASDTGKLSTNSQAVLAEIETIYPVQIETLIEVLLQDIQGMMPKANRAVNRVIMVGGSFWEENKTPAAVKGGAEGGHFPPPFPDHLRIEPLGIGDLRVVEQELCCYKAGEVAHIEPIMRGEKKERSTRVLNKTEDMRFSSVEKSKEDQKDTQTTDRFEMEKESSKIAATEMGFEAGFNMSASYGPTVKIGVNTGVSLNSSVQTSNSEAVSFGQEVTQRALKRIVEKTREERSTKTTAEFEELNLHSLDNTNGTDNVNGIYRWIDKYYKCRIINKGKRMMFQFFVPRPGVFHLQAMAQPNVEGCLGLDKPLDPREVAVNAALPILTDYNNITEANYATWSAAMGIEIPAPPKEFIYIPYDIGQDNIPNANYKKFVKLVTDITIPEGYETISVEMQGHQGGSGHFTVLIGPAGNAFQSNNVFSPIIPTNAYTSQHPLTLGIIGYNDSFLLGMSIKCRYTANYLKQWQIKAFQQIIDAYNKQKAAYDTALQAAMTRAGVQIKGTNPLINRDIEKNELRKWCMMHLFPVGAVAGHPYDPEFSTWTMQTWSNLTPFFFSNQVIQDAARIMFAENSFEWENIIYELYPYYWAPEHNWKEIYQIEDADPLFQKFLQAGFARVVVPVRPGNEERVLAFMQNGLIPSQVPNLPESEAIEALLNEMQNIPDPENPDTLSDFSWELRVPTTLVALQCGAGCIAENGLPCHCDDHEEDGFTPSHLVGNGTKTNTSPVGGEEEDDPNKGETHNNNPT